MIGRAFALTHTSFSRLLSHWLIREKTDPDLSAALNETRHRYATGFDLAIGDPSRLKHLEPVVSEGKLASAPRLSCHTAALLLAVLHFFRHQHKSALIRQKEEF